MYFGFNYTGKKSKVVVLRFSQIKLYRKSFEWVRPDSENNQSLSAIGLDSYIPND